MLNIYTSRDLRSDKEGNWGLHINITVICRSTWRSPVKNWGLCRSFFRGRRGGRTRPCSTTLNFFVSGPIQLAPTQ